MAARLTKRQADNAKDAIRTGLLLKRLQDHVLNDKKMTSSQIDAARILLKKTLPDLAVTQFRGDEDNPVQHSMTVRFVSSAG